MKQLRAKKQRKNLSPISFQRLLNASSGFDLIMVLNEKQVWKLIGDLMDRKMKSIDVSVGTVGKGPRDLLGFCAYG